MTKIADLSDFDMADYLTDDEAVAQYLSVVLAEGDAGELADALGHIAKARGMAQIAKDSGLGRSRGSTRSTGFVRRWGCGWWWCR